MRFTFKFVPPDYSGNGICNVSINDREVMWSGHAIHVHYYQYKGLAPLTNAYSTLRNKISMTRNQNNDTLHFMILFTSLILL